MKTKLNFTQSMKASAFAALSAALINALLFLIFHGSGVISDNIFIQPGQVMTIIPVLISSIVPTLLAGIVFFLFEKYSKNGFNNFRILSFILLLVSFINPFMGIPGVTTGYALALNLMHIVVVGALLFFIGKAAKNQKTN